MIRSPRNFLKHAGGLAFIEFALVFPFLFVLLFGSVEIVRMIYIQQKVEKAGYVISDVITRYLPATHGVKPGEINDGELNNNVFPIFGRIMGDDSTGIHATAANQAVIVTSVTHTGGVNLINWQIASPGTNRDNTLDACDESDPQNCTISVVNGRSPGAIYAAAGTVRNTVARFNGDPGTPTGKNTKDQLVDNPLSEGENMIISEIFYKYTPLLTLFLKDTHLETVTHINFILAPRIYTKRTFFIARNGALPDLPNSFPVIP